MRCFKFYKITLRSEKCTWNHFDWLCPVLVHYFNTNVELKFFLNLTVDNKLFIFQAYSFNRLFNTIISISQEKLVTFAEIIFGRNLIELRQIVLLAFNLVALNYHLVSIF